MCHYLYKNNSPLKEGIGNQLFGEFFFVGGKADLNLGKVYIPAKLPS